MRPNLGWWSCDRRKNGAFFARVLNTQITFVKDEAGLVTGLILQRDGRNLAAKKRM